MSKRALLIALPVILIVFLIWTWDGAEPEFEWIEAPAQVGASSTLSFKASDRGKGLASIRVMLSQGGQSRMVFEESFDGPSTPWASGRRESQGSIDLAAVRREFPLIDGEFELAAEVRDHANWWLFKRRSEVGLKVLFDATPPRVELLSSQHIIRQGGAEAMVYRALNGAVESGVLVDGVSYQGYPMESADGETFICIFAVRYDAPADCKFTLWARDAVGNQVERRVPVNLYKRRYRKRRLNISDSFIEKVVPEIFSTAGLERPQSALEAFLSINRDMRKRNDETIRKIGMQSAPRFLWTDGFKQLSNSKVEALFADERSYYYGDEQIDQQTHLGFDLASVANAPVEASNDGRVAFAKDLGIYGNCVIIDHGLGLQSLYAHLNSIDVEEGQSVSRGQVLGRTGQTGLAAGDHLHFSMYVQGTAVNPLEWWDQEWVENRILAKISPQPADD